MTVESKEERDALGRLVRETWVAWAREQPSPKPSWIVPWDELPEPDRDVDRRIGAAIEARTLAQLRAGVVPLTMTYDAAVSGRMQSPDLRERAYLGEIDALRAALAEARERAERWESKAEVHETERMLMVAARDARIRELEAERDAVKRAWAREREEDTLSAEAERDDARAKLAEAEAYIAKMHGEAARGA